MIAPLSIQTAGLSGSFFLVGAGELPGARPRRFSDPASPRRRGYRMNRREFITLLGGTAEIQTSMDGSH
jgi:hypothetical protein